MAAPVVHTDGSSNPLFCIHEIRNFSRILGTPSIDTSKSYGAVSDVPSSFPASTTVKSSRSRSIVIGNNLFALFLKKTIYIYLRLSLEPKHGQFVFYSGRFFAGWGNQRFYKRKRSWNVRNHWLRKCLCLMCHLSFLFSAGAATPDVIFTVNFGQRPFLYRRSAGQN